MERVSRTTKALTGKELDTTDLMKHYEKYYPQANNALEAYLEHIKKLTSNGTDLKTLNTLYADRQVKDFVLPLVQNWKEYKDMVTATTAEATNANQKDFNNMVESQGAGLKRMMTEWDNLAIGVNNSLAPVFNTLAHGAADALRVINGASLEQRGNVPYVGGFAGGAVVASEVKRANKPTPLKRALGGYTPANTLIKVGEEGPEHLVLPTAGHVIPNRSGAANGGSVVLNINVQTLPGQQQLTQFISMAKSRSGQLYDAPTMF